LKSLQTKMQGLLVLEPHVFRDARGCFLESYSDREFSRVVGAPAPQFLQDNHSQSVLGTIRGLHYQLGQPQGKLVRVVRGAIFDVAVDLRRSSPTFGHWVAQELSEENMLQMWIPAGFAHGFQALTARADVLYKATDLYAPQHERVLAWNDPALAISWPLPDPLVSAKDRSGALLADLEVYD
jgi:dTDP-4-dehydrorhamnose 3,5-epimerase